MSKALATVLVLDTECDRVLNTGPLPEGTPFCRMKMYLKVDVARGKKHQMPKNCCPCETKFQEANALYLKKTKKMKKPKVPDTPIAPAHFCPAMGCRRWFHTSCLISGSYTIKPKFMENMTFEDALARNVPDRSDINMDPFILQDGEQIPEDSIEKGKALLPTIYILARTPITRDKDHPFGNMRDVCIARKLLQHLQSEPDLETALGTVNWIALDFIEVEASPPSPLPSCFYCPLCGPSYAI